MCVNKHGQRETVAERVYSWLSSMCRRSTSYSAVFNALAFFFSFTSPTTVEFGVYSSALLMHNHVQLFVYVSYQYGSNK
jgi:hypothetical protein